MSSPTSVCVECGEPATRRTGDVPSCDACGPPPVGGAVPVWVKADPSEWGHLNDHEDVDPAEVWTIDDESDAAVWMTYGGSTDSREDWYAAVGRWMTDRLATCAAAMWQAKLVRTALLNEGPTALPTWRTYDWTSEDPCIADEWSTMRGHCRKRLHGPEACAMEAYATHLSLRMASAQETLAEMTRWRDEAVAEVAEWESGQRTRPTPLPEGARWTCPSEPRMTDEDIASAVMPWAGNEVEVYVGGCAGDEPVLGIGEGDAYFSAPISLVSAVLNRAAEAS